MPFTLPPVTRRSFLRTSLSAAAGGLIAQQKGFAKGVPDSESWILFSDSHIAADRALTIREVNMANHLMHCVKEALAKVSTPAGVIHSGDLAYNTGLAVDYQTLGALIQPLRVSGLPVHLMMGNHDDRAHFYEALSEFEAPSPVEHRIVGLVESPLANWFLLDSLDRTNHTPGLLGAEQLAWLEKALDAQKDKPAIIVVHHNVVPFNPPTKPSDGPLEAFADKVMTKVNQNALQDSADLLAVLRPRKQVKACIYGHTHTWLTLRDESGIHLINLPPTGYVFKAGLPSGWVHATLRTNSLELELHTVDPAHPQQGQKGSLEWRV